MRGMVFAMTQADLSAPKGARVGAAVLVILLHIVAVLALVRAFAPDFTGRVVETVASAITVTVTSPPPMPSPQPTVADDAPPDEGAAAPAGAKASPREVAAPRPRVPIAHKAAPPVSGSGQQDASGAQERGSGTGAGGEGSGTGSGAQGSGQGGGGGIGAKPVKIAGEINSARDYPRKTRDLRIGDHVVVALTIGTDGRVKACRIARASRDAEADRITCRLATGRFRFKPAQDAAGNPVEAEYGWRQRWFYPAEADTSAAQEKRAP